MDELLRVENHSRFRLGHTVAITGVLVFILLSLILSVIPVSNSKAFGASVIAGLSNQARVNAGLDSLSLSTQLTSAAQNKANDMVAQGYFDHTSPSGTTGWDYMLDAGYSYQTAGENLAASNEDDAAVVDGWMNSQHHRDNLLSTVYSEVGYGITYKGDFANYSGVSFIVALYASPYQNPKVVADTQTHEEQQTNEAKSADTSTNNDKASETEKDAILETPETVSTEELKTSEQPQVKTETETNNFVKNNDQVDSRITYGLATVGGSLTVSGAAIELQRHKIFKFLHK